MSQPPPPRYRIVERDGRLVTIDTWASKGADEGAQSRRGAPPTQRPDRLRTSRPADPSPPITEKLVAAVLRIRDNQGRRLLTTGPNWDRKGPRIIALSATGERILGRVLLAALLLGFGIILLAIGDLDLLLPVAIIGAVLFASMSTSGAPLLTRFLDSLGEDVRD